MKIISLVAVLLFVSLNAQPQSISLSNKDKEKLLDVVIPILKNCITNFDGKYLPGTTVDRIRKEAENKFRILGNVSYRGEQCGEVRNRDYKISFYKEGSRTYGETCIYSPYCFLGVVTSEEWDCACRKWQYGSDETIKDALEIFLLLKKISDNSESN